MAVIVALILLALILVLRRAARQKSEREAAAAEGQAGEAAAPSSGPARLRDSFRRAILLLRQHVSGRDFRYRIPWFCLLGQTGSRSQTLLAKAGLSLPYGLPEGDDLASGQGCNWWFFDRGVVLDLAGEYVLRTDGRTSDESGWKSFLRLLQQHRPQRPIDGFVLTVPCSDLLLAREGAERLAEIEQKADLLYRKLSSAQNVLGLRFPVYMLVTGCERIQGFTSFSEAISEKSHPEIFGWSSPYSIDAAYQSAWVDEAFEDLRWRIDQAKLSVLAERQEPKDADQVFLFPGEFRSLKEPLRAYLSHLFKSSAYHESIFFRGVYFCGGNGGPGPRERGFETFSGTTVVAAEDLEVQPRSSSAGVLFLRDLFERKIFPESGLALPTAGTLSTRNRKVRFAQISLAAAVLVLCLGLWVAHQRLDDRKPVLTSFLGQVADALRSLNPLRQDGGQQNRAVSGQYALGLLQAMAETDLSWFGSYFIPSSWFSGFNRDLTSSIVQTFDKAIFPALYEELNRRADELVRSPIVPASTAVPPPRITAPPANVQAVPVDQIPEFVTLRSYVDALLELQETADRYNRLPVTQDLAALSRTVNYLFGSPLARGFTEKADLYRKALAEAEYRPFEPEAFRVEAMAKAERLSERFFVALFRENVLVLDLARQQSLIEDLRRTGGQLCGEVDAARTLRTLLAVITRTAVVSAQPELRWIGRDTFDLGGAFDELVAKIERSVFLGPEIRRSLLSRSQQYWTELQRALADQGSAFTPEEIAALERLLEQDFVSLDGSLRMTTQAGTLVHWDTTRLERALSLYERYQSATQEGLDVYPANLRDIVNVVARCSLGNNMSSLVAEAQKFEAHQHSSIAQIQEPLNRTVENLQVAAPVLTRILGVFRQLDLRPYSTELHALLSDQGEHILSDIERLLVAEGLYLPKGGNFAWWDGQSPVVYEAFDVPDEPGLTSYLLAQRQRIGRLATRYAQPAMTLLGSIGSTPSLFTRWEGIVTELANHESQKPGNSVTSLETYISTQMPKITLGTCFSSLRPPSLRQANGEVFFVQRERFLQQALYERCQVLAQQNAAVGYAQLEQFFNQRLAGKFPFSEVTTGVPGPDADARDLRAFFKLFDRHERFILTIPEESPIFQGTGVDIHQFLFNMKEIRALFASFVDSEEPEPIPWFDVSVEFRVNRERARDADQIIEWELQVGEERTRYLEEPRVLRWFLGNPVRLRLRWAKDAPRAPFIGGAGPGAGSWESRTVAYDYTNVWSLLSLIRFHLSPKAELPMGASLPHTLKFVIETRPIERDGRPGPPSQIANAVAFIRLSLSAPGAAETQAPSSFTVPEIFPTRAPRLLTQVTSR